MTATEEERRAWDLYAASIAARLFPANSANLQDMTYVSSAADTLLEERRKRFPLTSEAVTAAIPVQRPETGSGGLSQPGGGSGPRTVDEVRSAMQAIGPLPTGAVAARAPLDGSHGSIRRIPREEGTRTNRPG